jgi:hypothetical protein
MEIPKTFTFKQASYEGTFKRGDIAEVDTTPRASYHKCFVLVYTKRGFRAYRCRELIQNKAMLIPTNLRSGLVIRDRKQLYILGVLKKIEKKDNLTP